MILKRERTQKRTVSQCKPGDSQETRETWHVFNKELNSDEPLLIERDKLVCNENGLHQLFLIVLFTQVIFILTR